MSDCQHRDRLGSTIIDPPGLDTRVCYRCGTPFDEADSDE